MGGGCVVLLLLAGLAGAQEVPWWWGLVGPDGSQGPSTPGVSQGTPTPAVPQVTPTPDTAVGEDPEIHFKKSSYFPCACDGDKTCLCVLYHQCKNGTINRFVVDELDNRFNLPKVEKCPAVQVCCQEPPRKTVTKPTEMPPTPTQFVTPPYTPEPETPSPKPPIDIPQPPYKSGCGLRHGFSPATDNTTMFAEFPWMLVIQKAHYTGDGKPPAFVFQCGGSLLHPQVALTAAHCVKRLLPTDIKVRAGTWDLVAQSEQLPSQERRVIKIIRHPQFEEATLFNDLALLILDKNFDQADNVDIICLPPFSTTFIDYRCIATGWGTTSPDTDAYRTTLKKVELPIVAHDTCEAQLQTTRLGRYFELHESFICAGGEPNVDTCRGDGGGPLVCPVPGDEGRYVQVGIVSWGIGCGESSTPAVYASVSHLRTWIEQQLADLRFNNFAIPPKSVEENERQQTPAPRWG